MAGWLLTLSEATARHRAWVVPHSWDRAFDWPIWPRAPPLGRERRKGNQKQIIFGIIAPALARRCPFFTADKSIFQGINFACRSRLLSTHNPSYFPICNFSVSECFKFPMNYLAKLSSFCRNGVSRHCQGHREAAGQGPEVPPPAGLGDGVRTDLRVRGAPVFSQPWSRRLARSRSRRTQAPASRRGRWEGQADEATSHGRWGGGWGGRGESFEEIYSDVLQREGHPSRGSVYKNFPAC